MGWVVADLASRWRDKIGQYHAFEWERCLADLGLTYRIVDLPASLPALIVNRTILVRRGMSSVATAFWVWHEVGHWVCHVGNREFWRTRPQGHLTLSKMERQATEFAIRFPDWDDVPLGGVEREAICVPY